MMMLKKSIAALLLTLTTTITGFGALPAKPDFAYPKTVSKNAEKELKAAIKSQNGPGALRAMLDYGLAQTAINPDILDTTMSYFSDIESKLKSPAAKAMVMLARADATGSDSLIIEAITRYGDAMKEAPTTDWEGVINADERFFPTLYDFAVAQTDNDSIINAALSYDASRPYPLIYLEMRRANDSGQYKALYLKHLGESTDIYPMTMMVQHANTLDERRQAYDLLKERAASGNDYKEALEVLTRPDVSCESNSVVARGAKLKVNVSATCLNAARLKVEMEKPVAKTIRNIDLKFEGEGVFRADTVIDLTLDEFGVYKLTPIFDGFNRKHPNWMQVTVTDFLIAKPSYGTQEFKPLALNVIDGAPQSDVKFTTVRNQLKGTRGADAYSPTIYNGRGYDPGNQLRKVANILTDRAIYHPGDTMRFAATLMESLGTKRSLSPGSSVKVILKNVNWQDVATQTLTSDDFGRINGSFLLPKEGLTGRYHLIIDGVDNVDVMVTDYKAPTFAVVLTTTRIDSTTVELGGTATGYNGFPVADAQVALTVNELPMWIWFRNFRNFRNNDRVAADTVSTDASGNFTARLTIPAGVNLSATATVTNPAGESNEESAFIPFNRYFIEGDIAQFTEAGKGPKFNVLNTKGEPTDIIPRITMNDSIAPDSDWSNVPSGEYTVKVSAEGAATQEYSTTVYRRTDTMPSTESALFVPVRTARPGDRLLVGTSYSGSNILMTVWTSDSIVEQRWLTPERGNFMLDVNLPEGIDDANMTLMTLRNYRFHETVVNIRRPDVARNLKIEISSLRDKMTPGEREIWTVKVTDNLGQPVQAAVMADAYCKALDALQPFVWRFNTPYIYGQTFDMRIASSYSIGAYNSSDRYLKNQLHGIYPGFNLWSQTWPHTYEEIYNTGASRKLYLQGMMTKKEVSTTGAADAVAELITITDDAAEVDNGLLMEQAVASSAAFGGDNESNTAEQYRLPEVAVALWRPVLTTAADGSLQIEFTAPNANTTWSVRTLAYSKDLLSATSAAEIVTSKPVMVEPELPRFMRVGDRMEFRAVVMNNIDSAARISSFIEFFDPATDTIIARHTFNNDLDAKASTVITMNFTAPDCSLTGVRVRATSGNFTDGEQALIAILPNRINVRTGRPLFVPSDSAAVTVNVPENGVMTFTANAVWECVSALPGLAASESRSALSAAASLFSAATARGLLRQHPEIGRALHSWEHEDSALISRLMKNDDLKIALLESTPFVNAAQSETERRARLLILFNNNETERTISSSITTLTKLMRNGGLAWTQNCDEPSQWITTNVLSTLAQLKRLGYLPQSKELNKIISDCLTYLDREVAKVYAKDKNARFEDYVMLRSRFPEVRQSAPARRAAEATVQYVVGHWRDMSLNGIARAAIILNENNYPTTARKLIESLRQHEAWAQLPLSPVLLEAFASVEPDCAEIETIRNEYISRKQSMDWGSGMQTSNLIAAILNSGAKWLTPAANELTVMVNDIPTDPTAESFSGEFRLDLPAGGKVEIRKGAFPAWGGVFSASADSITRVEPFSSEKLKLSRTIAGKLKVGEKVTVTLTLEAAQDLDYVIVKQPHSAGMQVVDQMPSTLWLGYLTAYREPTATSTNWFFNRLAKGKTVISETFYVTAEGTFSLAPAEAQSQYAPEFQSHTAGSTLAIE